jgi:hypothetical protein
MTKALLALLCLCPAAALAQPARTNPLTPAEVGCNQTQLARLLARMDAGGQELLVAYGDGGSFYEGLGVVGQGVFSGQLTPEYDLAFHLTPSLRELLLNPARAPLPQISLTREDSASNLVRPTNPHALTVRLNPQLPGAPGALLAINNLEIPAGGAPYNGFLGTSAGPGRGLALDGLVDSCHLKLTAFDHRIFSLLERLVRTSALLFLGGEDYNSIITSVTIFRGADPHTYRVDLYLGSPNRLDQRMAVATRIDWDEQGRLTTGRMEVLPVCAVTGDPECTGDEVGIYDQVTVRLIPPVLPGSQTWSETDPRLRKIVGGVGQSHPTPVDVDFAALLVGTAWNAGL